MKHLLIILLTLAPWQNKCSQDPDTKIIYRILGRGYEKIHTVDHGQFLVEEKGYITTKDSIALSPKDREYLIGQLDHLDLKELEKIKVTINNRASGRDYIGRFEVVKGEHRHMSPEFDHSNPPQELKPLIDHIKHITKKDKY